MTEREYQLLMTEVIEDLVDKAKSLNPENDYERGIVMGYYEILNSLKTQAEIFGVEPDSIGFKGFDPDSLIGLKKIA